MRIAGQNRWSVVLTVGALIVFGGMQMHGSTDARRAMATGWRALLSDGAWLRAYVAWERQDAPSMQGWIEVATRLDPRPVGYWLSGARMIAHDVPEWLPAGTPESVREQVRQEQLARALKHLARGQEAHPEAAALWIEEGNLQFTVAADLEGAARAYLKATRRPDAPFYAGRVYAELLRRQGRSAAAYVWLRQLHPRLEAIEEPALRERAMPDVVLARLRELEEQLQMAAEARYRQRSVDLPL